MTKKQICYTSTIKRQPLFLFSSLFLFTDLIYELKWKREKMKSFSKTETVTKVNLPKNRLGSSTVCQCSLTISAMERSRSPCN